MLSKTITPIITTLLLVLAPALAGCLDRTADEGDETTPDGVLSPGSTDDTNATVPTSGPAAPKRAFDVGEGSSRSTIHPFVVPGQSVRPPEHIVFEGEYAADDCTAVGLSWMLGEPRQRHPFTSKLQPGDAVSASVKLTWTNTEQQFADLHLFVFTPGQFYFDETQTANERGEVTMAYDFQFAYPGGRDADAGVGVQCWWAGNTEPIPYKIEVHLVFAEGVVPSGSPHLVKVDEGVKELRVSGAPDTPGGKVSGHYRLFDPADKLVGEFALNSDEAFDAVAIERPGDYVIIVDHSEGGMLALGADAPPADEELVVLEADWGYYVDYATSQPGPQQVTFKVDFPRVPLYIEAWVNAKDNSAGVGKRVALDIDSTRGRVWHMQIGGWSGTRVSGMWLVNTGLPSVDDWEFAYDHHALAEGEHIFTLDADYFDGEVFHVMMTYLRPGETGVPAPTTPEGGEVERLPLGVL